jgi:two-component system phosphate regulon response regulator PhoB
MAEGAVILICDDEPSVRDLMRLSLAPHHRITEAAGGAEAIELAERLHPDLVLLDVMMPGTTGLDVLAHLRGDPGLARAPVVVVSAHATDRDRLAAFDAGATEFVKKPFDPEELSALVEELLERN